MVKEDVKKLIKKSSYSTGYSYSSAKNKDDGWEKNDMGMWVRTSKNNTRGGSTASTNNSGTNPTLWDDAYDDGAYEWYEQQQQREAHANLVKLANGINPKTGARDVSKNMQKKAKKRLVKLAAREKAKAAARKNSLKNTNTEPKPGDYVIVLDDQATVQSVRDQCITQDERELAETLMIVPGRIDFIKNDLITVNGLDFWWDELRFATQDEIDMVEASMVV
jgi:hypothetical protein